MKDKIVKTIVSKEQYEQVRSVEKALGVKIAKVPEEWQLRVVDNIDGQWGIYQVIRCYSGINKYFADMKMLEPTRTKDEAVFKFVALQQQKAKEGKLKIKLY